MILTCSLLAQEVMRPGGAGEAVVTGGIVGGLLVYMLRHFLPRLIDRFANAIEKVIAANSAAVDKLSREHKEALDKVSADHKATVEEQCSTFRAEMAASRAECRDSAMRQERSNAKVIQMLTEALKPLDKSTDE